MSNKPVKKAKAKAKPKTKAKAKAKRKPRVKKNKGGRPKALTIDESTKKLVEELARQGLSGTQIALKLGISVDTFYTYKKKEAWFSESLEYGKSLADEMVVQALYSRAVGHSQAETKVFYDSKMNEVITQDIVKNHAPDVSAAIFWLKNRSSKKWKDRIEQQTSVEFLEPVIIEDDTGKQTTLTMKDSKE